MPEADANLSAPDAPSVQFDADLVLLTGMHRSGTSFLAKRLADAGLAFPGDLLPANEDNPEGYWEARDVVQLNNQILKSIGSDWRDHRAILDHIMEQLVADFTPAAAACLSALSQQVTQRPIVIKDPRLCRLLPIWSAAAEQLRWRTLTAATVRNAEGVARSLFRRNSDPKFRPAAVANPTKAYLLWARYMLDLAKHGQGHHLTLVPFSQVGAFDWSQLTKLPNDITLPQNEAAQIETRSLPDLCNDVFERFMTGASEQRLPLLQAQRQHLDQTLDAGTEDPAALDGPDLSQIATRFTTDAPAPSARRIGFVSGVPGSKGHIYRIENRIESLIGDDWSTFRIDPEREDVQASIEACDVLYVFRAEMDEGLNTLYLAAQRRGVPIIYDIDDLIFDPDFMRPEFFRYLGTLSADKQAEWRLRCEAYQKALQRADGAVFPTHALAEYGRKFCPNVHVVPNGLSHARIRTATKLPAVERDDLVIGYASGTATHDHDFEVVAPVLAEIMTAHPEVKLVLQGPVSGRGIELLSGLSDRIERRDLVPFDQLPAALQAFDINIAPLEIDNPFCQSKSQLKYFEAALVGVPSVVSATRCFADSIENGVTGYLASTHEDWRAYLSHLVRDADFRARMGEQAKEHALKDFAPERQKRLFKQAVQTVIDTAEANAPRRSTESGFSLMEVLVSLAIASLVSMLIFGSLRQQYQLIDRVQDASSEALDRQARWRLMSNILRNTSPAWPESEVEKFVGGPLQMSGVSGEAIFGDTAALQQYTVRLIQIGQVRTINLETEEGVWEIGTVPETATFSYYGHDGVWHATWPPQRPAPRTIAEMEVHAALGVLPALIKIESETETMSENWVFSIYNTDALGVRAIDLVGDLNPDF